MRRLALAITTLLLVLAGAFAGCSLNPHPLPPGDAPDSGTNAPVMGAGNGADASKGQPSPPGNSTDGGGTNVSNDASSGGGPDGAAAPPEAGAPDGAVDGTDGAIDDGSSDGRTD